MHDEVQGTGSPSKELQCIIMRLSRAVPFSKLLIQVELWPRIEDYGSGSGDMGSD